MQCYENKNTFGGFILDVFIQNRLRLYFTLLRSFCSFRSYFTRVVSVGSETLDTDWSVKDIRQIYFSNKIFFIMVSCAFILYWFRFLFKYWIFIFEVFGSFFFLLFCFTRRFSSYARCFKTRQLLYFQYIECEYICKEKGLLLSCWCRRFGMKTLVVVAVRYCVFFLIYVFEYFYSALSSCEL
jgi:hypothetical protein